MNPCGDTASRGGKAVNLNVTLQGCSMLMEQDTGAAVSIISEESFQRISGKGVTIKPSSIRLTSYTGDTITMLGMAEVDVTVQESVQPKYFIHPTSDCGKRERSIAAWPELVREDPSTMAEDIQS